MTSQFLKLSLRLKMIYLLRFFFGFFRSLKFKVLHLYNISRLKLSAARVGKKFSTSGTLILDIFPQSEVIIGNNVSIISDSHRATASSLSFPARIKTFSPTSRVIIDDHVGLNGTSITSRSKLIHIGPGTMIAPNVIILDSDFHPPWPPENRLYYPGDEYDKDVIIGKNCWIGMNSVILKGVHIGNNSIIGAGSIVVKDIPPDSLAAGNPAVVIKKYQ